METKLNHTFQQDNVPSGRIIRSDVGLFLAVLLTAVVMIVGMCALQAVLGFPLIIGQVTVFALLIAFGYLVYRTRLITYRYTMTERMFSVTRIVGKKEKPEYAIHLVDILSITEYAQLDTLPEKKHCPYHGRRGTVTVILYREGGKKTGLYVQLTPEMRDTLILLRKAARNK